MGIFREGLAGALLAADTVVLYQAPGLDWSLEPVMGALDGRGRICDSIEATVAAIASRASPGDQVLIMSNGGFGGIHERLLGVLGAELDPQPNRLPVEEGTEGRKLNGYTR
jgi:UDP-N-acetylmuramate: L-alanyl-gamma-D-glutamyl-meso-diaminopimelate ligase